MPKSYYETLGISPNAKENDIKTAYRRLVLKHHPDRSKDPTAPQIFRGIAEAFEVLSDPESRQRYDSHLEAEIIRKRDLAERKLKEQELQDAVSKATQTPGPVMPKQTSDGAARTQARMSALEISDMVRRLEILFGHQKFSECEMLAKQIIQLDPRQSTPYAILGDIARSRGQFAEAARMVSLALQMEPGNSGLLKRYEELLNRSMSVDAKGNPTGVEPSEKRTFGIFTIGMITLICCLYLILSPERPLLNQVGPISTWTVGLVAMLFLAGVSAGASLSLSNLIDRVDSYSTGQISSSIIFGLISILSFPVSLIGYGILGSLQRSFSVTTTRMMMAVLSITFCLALAAAVSQESVSFVQTLLWGGNLVYLGTIGGWAVADKLRP